MPNESPEVYEERLWKRAEERQQEREQILAHIEAVLANPRAYDQPYIELAMERRAAESAAKQQVIAARMHESKTLSKTVDLEISDFWNNPTRINEH